MCRVIILSNNSLLTLFSVIAGSVVLPAVPLSWSLGFTSFSSVYCSALTVSKEGAGIAVLQLADMHYILQTRSLHIEVL